MSTVIVAVIAAVVGPGIMMLLSTHVRRSEKAQDWARQDEVAAKAARAVAVAEEVAAGTATLLVESNNKLDVIHTLVNSSLTAAMQSELDAVIEKLALKKENIELKAAAGQEPSPETVLAIEATTDRIGELRAGLSDRLRQARIVDEQLARQTADRPVVIPGVED